MRKTILSAALAIGVCAGASGQTGASFAIVVDDGSYTRCRTEIELYMNAVREQGLDAFILEKQWESPDEIRDTLRYYYANRHLEGAVFIGDIPVPMIRKAQHFASAFKMDEERFPMRDSSIPSDRLGMRRSPRILRNSSESRRSPTSSTAFSHIPEVARSPTA